MKQLYIDLETTGIIQHKARIVEIGLIYENGEFNDSKNIRINPTMPIPEIASNVHKIYDDDVKDCATFNDLAPRLIKLIQKADVIIGYNIVAYDWNILRYEFLRSGIELDDKPLIDIYLIWNKLKPRQKYEKRRLSDAVIKFTGEEIENAHSAITDITYSKKVLDGMMKEFNFNIKDCINFR